MSKLSEIIEKVQVALNDEALPEDGNGIETLFSDGIVGKKQMVIEAIHKRSKEVQEEDLPRVIKEMKTYFSENQNRDYLDDYVCDDYFRLLDLHDRPDARIVVVGDIHSDFKSLSAILLKLTVSDYDYYENAHFVFLGDYLDRGGALFETLLLLMDLKKILEDRLIMLRGNHELIKYYDTITIEGEEHKEILYSRVRPMQSCPTLNQYCGKDTEFLRAFGEFYRLLPTYVYLKVADQNIILTHASVPRQMFFDTFHYDENTGAIVFEDAFLFQQSKKAEENVEDDSLKSKTALMNNTLLVYRNKILQDMIWGDPRIDKEKYQVSGRFEFGSQQFDAYAEKNNISKLFRSHEPVDNGFVSFFNNRLYTIFSTGGNNNEQTGYEEVNPAFVIMRGNGSFCIEHSYIYRVCIAGVFNAVCNPFSGEFLAMNDSSKLSISEEFTCTGSKAKQIRDLFDELNKGFEPVEKEDTSSEEDN